MRVRERLVALREQRVDPFLRTFEWTWTTAVLFCLFLLFFSLITMVIFPSFWMYFAEQKLGWGGPSGGGTSNWYWLEVRDAIAMGLTTGPFVTVLVIAGLLQNHRRRLRGRTGDTRPTGGYR
jgi:ABC-type Fe3+ transport system permease subunit